MCDGMRLFQYRLSSQYVVELQDIPFAGLATAGAVYDRAVLLESTKYARHRPRLQFSREF
jgi:hypothetical protein